MLLLDASPMIPGGWVIHLIAAIITAILAGLAGWKARERTIETTIAGQPLTVRAAREFATAEDLAHLAKRMTVLENRLGQLITEWRAENDARETRIKTSLETVAIRIHHRVDEQNKVMQDILRALGRLEGTR